VIVSIKHQSRDGVTFINVTGTSPVTPAPAKKAARR